MARELILRFGEFGELRGGRFALGGESSGSLLIGLGCLSQRRTQCLEDFVAVFDLGELAAHIVAESDDLGDGFAVFALEAIEQGEAVFDFGEALG